MTFDGSVDFVCGPLLDQIRFSGGLRFIAFDVLPSDKYSVYGDHVSWFKVHDISNEHIKYGYFNGSTAADDVNVSVLLFAVEFDELAFLLKVVERPDDHHDQDGCNDSNSFDPLNFWVLSIVLGAESLVKAN